jgi:hypothetical protein
MDIGRCPSCGAGLVDRVVSDSRSTRAHSERVGEKCSNPSCGYRTGADVPEHRPAAASPQP